MAWGMCALLLLAVAPEEGTRQDLGRILHCLMRAAEESPEPGPPTVNRCVEAAAALPVLATELEPLSDRLLVLAFFFDYRDVLLAAPLVGPALAGLESIAEKERRRELTRTATVFERRDLVAHFFVAAALTAKLGARATSSLSLQKEREDARRLEEGHGTGFSFVDVCANEAGIRFALQAQHCPGDVALLHGFRLLDYMPGILGLPEGITATELERDYGGFRLDSRLQRIHERIAACPAYRRRDSLPADGPR